MSPKMLFKAELCAKLSKIDENDMILTLLGDLPDKLRQLTGNERNKPLKIDLPGNPENLLAT